MTVTSRWRATVVYRTAAGPLVERFGMAELAELHDHIEQGPHWDCVVTIEVIRINHCTSPTLTIEQAEQMRGPDLRIDLSDPATRYDLEGRN